MEFEKDHTMPEIELSTYIHIKINVTCMLCGEKLEANIKTDSHNQVISISVDPSHNCYHNEIEETNKSIKQDFSKRNY